MQECENNANDNFNLYTNDFTEYNNHNVSQIAKYVSENS